LLFLFGRFPSRDQVVVFAFCVMPDLEDHRTKASTTPADCTELFRIVILLVDQVSLVEDLLRFFQADAVPSLDGPALRSIENEARIRI
jgi:hypothetical protein